LLILTYLKYAHILVSSFYNCAVIISLQLVTLARKAEFRRGDTFNPLSLF